VITGHDGRRSQTRCPDRRYFELSLRLYAAGTVRPHRAALHHCCGCHCHPLIATWQASAICKWPAARNGDGSRKPAATRSLQSDHQSPLGMRYVSRNASKWAVKYNFTICGLRGITGQNMVQQEGGQMYCSQHEPYP
jgi:hypothetical protein